jgi:hypothetical protein
MLRVVPMLRVVAIATAIVVCCTSAFAQMGGGGQLPGAGTSGIIGGPNTTVNPGINDGPADNFSTAVTRGNDPPAGGNQVPLPRTPSANDSDEAQR